MTGRRILRIAITSLQSLHLRKVSVSLLKPPRIMGSQNWGSQNPKQSLTSRFWEGPMILTANKNSEDSKKTPTFWVCISKLPWFHCWLVQVLLKHYQFLGFFFPPTSNQISPPPKKKLSVGPRRRGIAMWEILRCKKWPGPREFSSLWEQPIM